MKKILLFMFATVFCGSIFAQEQGSMMIDGAVGMDYTMDNWKSDDDGEGNDTSVDDKGTDKTGTFTINLSGGYFIMDGMALGLAIDMESTNNTSNSGADGETDFKMSSSHMKFGPMVRYYIGETGVFGQLAYLMGSGSYKADGTEYAKTKSSTLSIGAGYAIALADNVHLNPMLKYNMDTDKDVASDVFGNGDNDDVTKSSGIQFNVGLTIMM